MKNKDIFGILFVIVIIGIVIWFFLGLPSKPTYQGKNMAQWLKILRSNNNSAESPLKIIRLTKDGNWLEIEIPISFDSLVAHEILGKNGYAKHGKFDLMINNDNHLLSTDCERSTNGNCILGCDINDFTHGTNQVRVAFFIDNSSNKDHPLYAEGDPTEYVSSEAVYIHPKIFTGRDNQIVLWADLSVSNADYSIELFDTNNNSIKTITGHTSDGTINAQWNLIGDSGKTYPRDAFGVIYHVAVSNLSEIVTQDYKIPPP